MVSTCVYGDPQCLVHSRRAGHCNTGCGKVFSGCRSTKGIAGGMDISNELTTLYIVTSSAIIKKWVYVCRLDCQKYIKGVSF